MEPAAAASVVEYITPLNVILIGLAWALWRVVKGFAWLATTGRLVGVFTGLMTSASRVVFEKTAMRRLADTSRLPALITPRSWKDYVEFGVSIKHRLEVFWTAFEAIKLPFHSPYASSVRLAKEVRPSFEDHLRSVKAIYATFTRFADCYFTIWTRIMHQVEEATRELQQEVNELDKKLNLCFIRRRRIRLGGMRLAGWSKQRRREWRECQRDIKSLKKQLRKAAITCRRKAEEVFAEHELELAEPVHQLMQLDSQVLQHGVHGLVADANVLVSLVFSGDIFNLLAEKGTPASKQLRSMLKLPEEFPTGVEAVRKHMLEWLRDPAKNRNVALSNTPAREDVLEWFLRYWLYEHIDVSFLDNAYLEDLPAPAASGLANQAYGYPGTVWPPKSQLRKAPKAKQPA